MRDAVALIFSRDDLVQRLEILKLNHGEVSPFGFRFESGSKLPFAAMPHGSHQTGLALFGFLAPFVFFHDSRKPGHGAENQSWQFDCRRSGSKEFAGQITIVLFRVSSSYHQSVSERLFTLQFILKSGRGQACELLSITGTRIRFGEPLLPDGWLAED